MSDNSQEFRHFAFVVDGVVKEIMSIASGPEWNQFHELYGHDQPLLKSRLQRRILVRVTRGMVKTLLHPYERLARLQTASRDNKAMGLVESKCSES